jgi:hypothetical protein
MATLNFSVAFSTDFESVKTAPVSSTVYAEDLGNCQPCVNITSSCWSCLTIEQQVFQDVNLTSIVPDGFYRVEYSPEDPNAIWHIIGGFPQPEGFTN